MAGGGRTFLKNPHKGIRVPPASSNLPKTFIKAAGAVGGLPGIPFGIRPPATLGRLQKRQYGLTPQWGEWIWEGLRHSETGEASPLDAGMDPSKGRIRGELLGFGIFTLKPLSP